MKLIDIPKFESGTFMFKLASWFVNNINWCEGYYYGTDVTKPDNKVYNFFYTYWLFPFVQNGCMCCNTTRGVVYGILLGYLIGVS